MPPSPKPRRTAACSSSTSDGSEGADSRSAESAAPRVIRKSLTPIPPQAHFQTPFFTNSDPIEVLPASNLKTDFRLKHVGDDADLH
jgi:hypothetical protein